MPVITLTKVIVACVWLTWLHYRKPDSSCSYVSPHYKSHCVQVYNYHRLLSFEESRGMHVDIYKVRHANDGAVLAAVVFLLAWRNLLLLAMLLKRFCLFVLDY